MLLKYCTQHASKFGNLSSGHRTGKGSFSSQSQRRTMTKNIQTATILNLFACYQGNAQNHSSEASTVPELRTSRYSSWIWKRQRNQRSNCQYPLDHRKSNRILEKHLLLHWLHWRLCGSQKKKKTGKFLKRYNTRPFYLPPEKPIFRSRSNR